MTTQPDWGQRPQGTSVSPTLPAHGGEEVSPVPCAHAKAPSGVWEVLLGSAAFVVWLAAAGRLSSWSPGFNRAGAFLPWVLSCSGHCGDPTLLSCSQLTTSVQAGAAVELQLFQGSLSPSVSYLHPVEFIAHRLSGLRLCSDFSSPQPPTGCFLVPPQLTL